MNKLMQVSKALESDLSIKVIKVREDTFLTAGAGAWTQTIDFIVAPMIGCFHSDKLQALMLSLVPGLEPSQKDDFRQSGDTLRFGKLYFDECIGTETVHRELVITDESLLALLPSRPDENFIEGRKVTDSAGKLNRRTLVRLYPSINIATRALKGEDVYETSLANYSGVVARGFFGRLFGFFIP